MRTCAGLYNGVRDEQLQDGRPFRYAIGGAVPIHGFIVSRGGDD
jgi:hypothetical protein